jgi:hypothetical protein
MTFHYPEDHRLKSASSHGESGFFLFRHMGRVLRIVASHEEGWEHVSISLHSRCPTWEEMCAVKDLFWDEDDCVIQYHPPKSDYVNCHPHCLHLWRPVGVDIPRPPKIMVGW